MTRPDKHAARFGARYQPPIDWRRFRDGLQKGRPAIRRMTDAFRQVADNMRQAHEMVATARQVQAVINGPGERWTYLPHVANTAAPTLAELQAAATPLRGPRPNGPSADILDRIDDTLLSYDAQRSTGEPWPFESF